MRILHTDTDDIDNPLGGGQPIRTYSVNSRIAARHDITVLTSVYKGSVRRLSRGNVHYRRLGFRIPFFGLSPHLSFLSFLGCSVKLHPHDLVVEEFTPPFGFCALPWFTKKPVILIVQWYFFEQWEKRYRLPFSRIMRRIAASGRYHHVIVQTKAMLRELQPLMPNANFRHIPCGIDNSAFSEGPSDGDYVLFLGRLDIDHKGLDLLVEAWSQICAIKEIPLVVAGSGQAQEELERLIDRRGLKHLVKLVGKVSGEAKREAIAKCRLMVVPSRYETFGISALESMAAAKPVVCFDIDHLNELISNEWGRLVPKFDSAAFGQAVSELWDSPETCLKYGASGQNRARDYKWDEIARQQETFYIEVTKSRL